MGFAEPKAENVGEDLVSDDTQLRKHEPKDALVDIVGDKHRGTKHEYECEHWPSKSLELVLVRTFLETPYEPKHAKDE